MDTSQSGSHSEFERLGVLLLGPLEAKNISGNPALHCTVILCSFCCMEKPVPLLDLGIRIK